MNKVSTPVDPPVYTSKDFKTDQDVRWCPGCGDYAILAQTQRILPDIGIRRENLVVVSGIGCSSRFPYYLNSYGIHSIHGRATAIATGLKASRPELSVWIVTGDGDSLSIGGNHLIHILRRNLDVNILLFNNRIYGLTKGQYSPTSEVNKVTSSTPSGSIDFPFNPAALALGANATFVAKSMDVEAKHLQEILRRSYTHKGTSFLEIYQNCNIYNDHAFKEFSDKEKKPETTVFLQQGQPLIFGKDSDKGLRFDGSRPEVVSLKDGFSPEDLWIHDEKDINKAQTLARLHPNQPVESEFPKPFGVYYAIDRPTYEDELTQQIERAIETEGKGDLNKLLAGAETWKIKD